MKKYGFDSSICNYLCDMNDILCKIEDEYKFGEINRETYLKKRISCMYSMKNFIDNTIYFENLELFTIQGGEKK